VRLADLQDDIGTAVVDGAIPGCAGLLVGGDDPTRRFEIHSRHYATSVARSLVERFAATVWVAGSELVAQAAMEFAREHPPTRPCMAEYGDGFPAYLASCGATRLPYLGQFATVDWHLGRLAIAVDAAPLLTFAACDPEQLAGTQFTLQPGTEYVALDWSLDELIAFYLSGQAPDRYELRKESVWLELRGCRGELWLNRLRRGDYVFRQALAEGCTLGRAAELAVGAHDGFEPGRAMRAMLDAGLVAGIVQARGDESCGFRS
jgi:hypothetical protein